MQPLLRWYITLRYRRYITNRYKRYIYPAIINDANAEHFYGVNMEDAADMPESDRELVFKKIIIEKFRDIVKHP